MADIFRSHLVWSGAAASLTGDTKTLNRDMEVSFEGTTLPMSAAPSYHGDPSRANPEQLLVAAVSACQALTFLSLCARKGIEVAGYTDAAQGTLEMIDGKMRMSAVTLHPHIALEEGSDELEVGALIDRAHRQCFIANSVSATIHIEPSFERAAKPALAVGADVDESC
jgi:organic hydroperoxide reductase OsmC/OhrA